MKHTYTHRTFDSHSEREHRLAYELPAAPERPVVPTPEAPRDALDTRNTPSLAKLKDESTRLRGRMEQLIKDTGDKNDKLKLASQAVQDKVDALMRRQSFDLADLNKSIDQKIDEAYAAIGAAQDAVYDAEKRQANPTNFRLEKMENGYPVYKFDLPGTDLNNAGPSVSFNGTFAYNCQQYQRVNGVCQLVTVRQEMPVSFGGFAPFSPGSSYVGLSSTPAYNFVTIDRAVQSDGTVGYTMKFANGFSGTANVNTSVGNVSTDRMPVTPVRTDTVTTTKGEVKGDLSKELEDKITVLPALTTMSPESGVVTFPTDPSRPVSIGRDSLAPYNWSAAGQHSWNPGVREGDNYIAYTRDAAGRASIQVLPDTKPGNYTLKVGEKSVVIKVENLAYELNIYNQRITEARAAAPAVVGALTGAGTVEGGVQTLLDGLNTRITGLQVPATKTPEQVVTDVFGATSVTATNGNRFTIAFEGGRFTITAATVAPPVIVPPPGGLPAIVPPPGGRPEGAPEAEQGRLALEALQNAKNGYPNAVANVADLRPLIEAVNTKYLPGLKAERGAAYTTYLPFTDNAVQGHPNWHVVFNGTSGKFELVDRTAENAERARAAMEALQNAKNGYPRAVTDVAELRPLIEAANTYYLPSLRAQHGPTAYTPYLPFTDNAVQGHPNWHVVFNGTKGDFELVERRVAAPDVVDVDREQLGNAQAALTAARNNSNRVSTSGYTVADLKPVQDECDKVTAALALMTPAGRTAAITTLGLSVPIVLDVKILRGSDDLEIALEGDKVVVRERNEAADKDREQLANAQAALTAARNNSNRVSTTGYNAEDLKPVQDECDKVTAALALMTPAGRAAAITTLGLNAPIVLDVKILRGSDDLEIALDGNKVVVREHKVEPVKPPEGEGKPTELPTEAILNKDGEVTLTINRKDTLYMRLPSSPATGKGMSVKPGEFFERDFYPTADRSNDPDTTTFKWGGIASAEYITLTVGDKTCKLVLKNEGGADRTVESSQDKVVAKAISVRDKILATPVQAPGEIPASLDALNALQATARPHGGPADIKNILNGVKFGEAAAGEAPKGYVISVDDRGASTYRALRGPFTPRGPEAPAAETKTELPAEGTTLPRNAETAFPIKKGSMLTVTGPNAKFIEVPAGQPGNETRAFVAALPIVHKGESVVLKPDNDTAPGRYVLAVDGVRTTVVVPPLAAPPPAAPPAPAEKIEVNLPVSVDLQVGQPRAFTVPIGPTVEMRIANPDGTSWSGDLAHTDSVTQNGVTVTVADNVPPNGSWNVSVTFINPLADGEPSRSHTVSVAGKNMNVNILPPGLTPGAEPAPPEGAVDVMGKVTGEWQTAAAVGLTGEAWNSWEVRSAGGVVYSAKKGNGLAYIMTAGTNPAEPDAKPIADFSPEQKAFVFNTLPTDVKLSGDATPGGYKGYDYAHVGNLIACRNRTDGKYQAINKDGLSWIETAAENIPPAVRAILEPPEAVAKPDLPTQTVNGTGDVPFKVVATDTLTITKPDGTVMTMAPLGELSERSTSEAGVTVIQLPDGGGLNRITVRFTDSAAKVAYKLSAGGKEGTITVTEFTPSKPTAKVVGAVADGLTTATGAVADVAGGGVRKGVAAIADVLKRLNDSTAPIGADLPPTGPAGGVEAAPKIPTTRVPDFESYVGGPPTTFTLPTSETLRVAGADGVGKAIFGEVTENVDGLQITRRRNGAGADTITVTATDTAKPGNFKLSTRAADGASAVSETKISVKSVVNGFPPAAEVYYNDKATFLVPADAEFNIKVPGGHSTIVMSGLGGADSTIQGVTMRREVAPGGKHLVTLTFTRAAVQGTFELVGKDSTHLGNIFLRRVELQPTDFPQRLPAKIGKSVSFSVPRNGEINLKLPGTNTYLVTPDDERTGGSSVEGVIVSRQPGPDGKDVMTITFAADAKTGTYDIVAKSESKPLGSIVVAP